MHTFADSAGRERRAVITYHPSAVLRADERAQLQRAQLASRDIANLRGGAITVPLAETCTLAAVSGWFWHAAGKMRRTAKALTNRSDNRDWPSPSP